MLEAEEIVVVRGARRIVDGVSLVLEAGTTTLEGPSGGGKSTLLRALARLVPLAAGRIHLASAGVASTGARSGGPAGAAPSVPGEASRTSGPGAYRREVAYVPQHPVMLEGSVADNVRAGPRFAGETLSDVAVIDLLARVGLARLASAPRAAALSGGEQGRLALARALANRPRVLLLDEPTAALDASSAEHVLATVAALEGVAVLVVTHVAAHAQALGGRRLRMENGVLV